MKRLFVIIILLLSVNYSYSSNSEKYLSCPGSATQTTNFNTKYMGGTDLIHWTNFLVHWRLNINGAGDGLSFSETQTALNNAFNTWENVTTSNISFQYDGGTNNTWAVDNINVIYWAEEGDPIYDSTKQILHYALTYITVNSNQEIIDVDIVFTGLDNKVTWNIDGTDTDLQSIATHEIGHMIGLAHTENNEGSPTMYGDEFVKGISWRTIEFLDKVGVSFLYGGNIIADKQLIYSENEFKWTVTVASGNTFTIGSNRTVKFGNDVSFNINGNLIINGVSSGIAILTKMDGVNKWQGLRFHSGSSGNLNYAHIENCYVGIYMFNSSPDIFYTEISNVTGHGVQCFYYSNPNFYQTTIRNSAYYGVYCLYYSDPVFADLSGHQYPTWGHNIIKDNQIGIFADYYSEPWLGNYFGGGNSIYSNTNYAISANYGSNVYAEKNWWGNYPPNAADFYYYQASIDYLPALSYDPNLNKSNSEINLTAYKNKINSSDFRSIYNEAQLLKLSGNINDAINRYNYIIYNNDQYDDYFVLSIKNMFKILNSSEQRNFYNALLAYIKQRKELIPNYDMVLYDITNYYYFNIDYSEYKLKENINNILSNRALRDSYMRDILLNFVYVQYKKKDQALFSKYLEMLTNQNSSISNADINQIISPLGITVMNKRAGVDEIISSEKNLSSLQIYPNPFNHSTNIKYTLPINSHVNIVLYNQLGEEIKTFVDAKKSKGDHNFIFNAKNLPSGLYFISLRIDKSIITQKLILLK